MEKLGNYEMFPKLMVPTVYANRSSKQGYNDVPLGFLEGIIEQIRIGAWSTLRLFAGVSFFPYMQSSRRRATYHRIENHPFLSPL